MAARFGARGVARLKAILQENVDRGRAPGLVAMLGCAGEVHTMQAFGRRDPSAADAMREDAIFRIYSMTKPVVSLAALMLAEEGRVSLVDPVSKYLPELAGRPVAVEEAGGVRLVPSRRDPTVHDLLRHTSGYTYDFVGTNAVQKMYAEANILARGRTLAEFIRALAALPLQEQPGTCWQYSVSTDVLGAVVQAVSGQPLGGFLRERIFGPLGMEDTAFSVPREQWHRIAEPFPNDPDSGVAVQMIPPREVPAFESGGGGLLSTAADYTRFLQLMRNRGTLDGVRIVSRKTVEWMTSDHLGGLPARGDLLLPGYGFGLGFSVRTHEGLAPQPGSAGQYFWSGIGGTSFFVDPREDVFAMLLTQAPYQRFHFRNLFRHLVYAALD